MKDLKRILGVLAIAVAAAGCVSGPYVDSRETNPVSRGAYTRAETIAAAQRLVDAIWSDPVFAQHYAAKVQQRGGAPVVQVAYVENLTTERNGSLDMLRESLEEALQQGGRFLLGGDPDACDYILRTKYRSVQDGRRVTHRVAARLHDISADLDVWTGSDEIAKE